MSSLNSRELESSQDEQSIAEEVQNFNQDVISDIENKEDLIGSEVLTRAISRRNTLKNDNEQGTSQQPLAPPRRRSTIVQSIKDTDVFQNISKFSWWDTEFKRDRIKVYSQFLQNYVLLCVVLCIILCIYWGSYYHRDRRFVNLKFLVVNDDQSVDNITPIIGNSVGETARIPSVAAMGNWHVYSHTEFLQIAEKQNNTIKEEVFRQVHHQKYWAAIYVKENITYALHEAIENGQTFNITENMVEFIYETGRDLITMGQYIVPHGQFFERAYLQVVASQLTTFVGELSNTTTQAASLDYLSQPFSFYYNDVVPVDGAILLAPLQLGLTYLVVFAFFNLVMTIKIQIYISTIVKGFNFILLRLLISHISYIVISLGYVIVNVAFKVPVTHTFGKSGGLVLWAFSYLTMASLGSINEVVALLCFTYYPKLIGGWLVLFISLNVAPTVSAIALTNHFYRYGYAMPIHNSSEAVKVVFSDIYKGQLGRNIGILVAWIVIANLALPFVMIHVAKVKERRSAKEKLKQQSAE